MTSTIVARPLTKGELWQRGFTAYMDGTPLAAMGSAYEREGWESALKAEAQATMPPPLSAKDADAYTDDYVEEQLDREWWRRGQW